MDNSNQASTNYREAFQLFDKRGNGRVDRSALGDLLRACGQNPTLAEIGDLERGVGTDCTFLALPLSNHAIMRLTDEQILTPMTSRLRNLLQDPQPPRRLPRTLRHRGIHPRLPGLRQGPERLRWQGPDQVYLDEPGREDERGGGRRAV
jgi:hypothetical protein